MNEQEGEVFFGYTLVRIRFLHISIDQKDCLGNNERNISQG